MDIRNIESKLIHGYTYELQENLSQIKVWYLIQRIVYAVIFIKLSVKIKSGEVIE